MTPKIQGLAGVTATIVLGTMVFAATTADAQTVIGQRNSASVSVDLSVLDQLGTTPTVPQLLQPSVRSLLMPNARQPARSRFAPLSRPQLSSPSLSAGSVKLKPPSKTMKRAAPAKRRVAKKAPPKPRVTAPAAPKIAPPPPKVAAAPKALVAPPPPPAAPAPPKAAPEKPVSNKVTAAPPPPPPSLAPPAPAASAAATPAPPPPPPPAINPPKPAVKAPPPQQTAALTSRPAPTGALKPGQQFRLGFSGGSAAISDGAETQLDGVSKALKQDGNLRLQLLAYAAAGSQTPSQARRLSLSRALAVRSQLIEKGIRSTRIDVRALGNKSEGGPPDRVDIIITTR